MAVITAFFAFRFTASIIYWSDPAHQNQPVETWMTIGYIAHSHSVPRDRLAEALELEDQQGGRVPVGTLAEKKGVSFAVFKARIDQAITELQQDSADP